MQNLSHWIDGAPSATTPTDYGEIFNPADGSIQARVPFAARAELEVAVGAARRALASWATTSISARTEIMFEFRQLLSARRRELATIVTAEHGKVLDDSLGEIARGLENVEYACGLGSHLKGEFTASVATGVDVHSLRQPVGVVAAITPFNFPAMVPLWMTANALACGNTMVLKPSEKDPSASLFLAGLLKEAGLPDGVFNVLHGDGQVVGMLLVHPGIDAVSFVGSTPIARSIYTRATAAGKRVQALGGAKNHMVVLADADLDVAADAAVSAAYGSAGERCMAVSVLVAMDKVADPLVEAIAARLGALRVGPGDDPASQMGPLISAAHRDAVAGYVGRAAAEGASVVIDGRCLDLEGPAANGFFLGASLVDHVRPGMAVYDDEIFGPVLSVVRVQCYEEAVELINANPFGNGVAIFTRDGGTARRFTLDAKVGMVGVNVAIPIPVASYSFGGWKDSLFGHSHIYGPAGIDFYTRSKVVTTRWPEPSGSVVDLGFPTTRSLEG
jgi:malonate-semialdehyde dehydrogenase (acetylating)/methylmalonate-semialdehyde dehydrogenase